MVRNAFAPSVMGSVFRFAQFQERYFAVEQAHPHYKRPGALQPRDKELHKSGEDLPEHGCGVPEAGYSAGGGGVGGIGDGPLSSIEQLGKPRSEDERQSEAEVALVEVVEERSDLEELQKL